MPKLDDTGVYRKNNGCWEYRFGVVIGGKTIFRKKSTDEHGNKLLTKSAAVAAREMISISLDQYIKYLMDELTTKTDSNVLVGKQLKRVLNKVDVADGILLGMK